MANARPCPCAAAAYAPLEEHRDAPVRFKFLMLMTLVAVSWTKKGSVAPCSKHGPVIGPACIGAVRRSSGRRRQSQRLFSAS